LNIFYTQQKYAELCPTGHHVLIKIIRSFKYQFKQAH